MTHLPHDRYCDEITHQAEQFRALLKAPGADLSATVPTCPDWTLEQLTRHLGGALRWIELMVRTRAQEQVPEERVPLGGGPQERGDLAALDAWFAESAAAVVAALREAGPDAQVWSWAGVFTAGFWARRVTHEITVHRADAALTVGVPYEVAADVAADAIDEWLDIVTFVQRHEPHDAAAELRGGGRSLHLHATDAPGLDAEWVIELAEAGVEWRRGHERATVALRGPLTQVLLAFYRRVPLESGDLEVVGEREVLDFWLERATFG
ncbi:maleylpyruvate isomerase family mycothiol-dependent enzyme [Streptomyces sp. NPDC091377]|uniref:maleylpyruvate isomerase family mycothiol-dependent enzyme n=1 Tax=Streptomyces sp. NPDC091377 TaxID=3365995 RepID=UPI00381D8864